MTGTFKNILLAAAVVAATAVPSIASASIMVNTPAVTRTTSYTLKSVISAANPLTPATFDLDFKLAETGGVYSLTAVSGTNGTATFGLNNVGLVAGPLGTLTIGGTLNGVDAGVLVKTNDFYANFVPDITLPFSNTLVVSSFFSNTDFFPSFGPLYLTTGATVVTTPAVPEPATWAMMLVGFGMVGAAVRYRRKRTTVVYA